MSGASAFIATTDLSVPVIGAGIGGLTAALALARHGIFTEVFEQADALTEVGAGIQLTPNGLRLLDRLGLGDALRAAGAPAPGLRILSGLSGRSLAVLPFDPGQYLFIYRPDLIDILAGAVGAAGVAVHLGDRVTPDDLDSPVVVAADGVHSATRLTLNPRAAARYAGLVAYRTTVRALPSDPPEARLWTLPDGHVVAYPIGGARVNLVAVRAERAWNSLSWSEPAESGDLIEAFPKAAPALKALLFRADEVTKWGLREAAPIPTWHDGRTVLIGDAAHPTLPFLAQGANMAIEDGYLLARLIAEHGPDALPHFQSLRQNRTRRIVAAADLQGRIYHARGPARWAIDTGLRALGSVAPGLLPRRYGWIHNFDADAI